MTRLPLEPRLLSRELAAAYCSLSLPTFEGVCPVIPVKIRSRVLYDRLALDRWLDSLGPEQPKFDKDSYLRRLDDAHANKGH